MTVRQAIAAALADRPLTAHELSQAVGVAEREIAAHVAHLERTVQRSGQRLRTLPARCCECEFVFEKRTRKARPSRCPVCRSERLEPPRFVITQR
jgi:predicted Zn-ribbon and HTH transcriptional regulator